MLNLMIVDDEPKVRDGLKTIIDWKYYGYNICDECSDGLEALGSIQACRPDVIMVDVKMPEMDGLEFIRQAKAQGCKSKFIILTGYSDFEYTQKAIQMGVNSYLLKPVEEDELIQIVRELHDLIINEQEILNYVVSGRKHLKEAAIRDVLKGEASGSEAGYSFGCNNNFKDNSYQIVLIEKSSGNMGFCFKYELQELLTEMTGECCKGACIFELDGRVCAVIPDKNKSGNIRLLHQLKKQIRENSCTDLFIAVGRAACDAAGLSESYLDAVRISEMKFYYGHAAIVQQSECIEVSECSVQTSMPVVSIPAYIEKLYIAAEIGDAARIEALINPSGSGKSTLLSMLAGLDLPSEGEILLGENSLKKLDLDRYRRENVSMIFQAFQLFPLLTVIENVCYPMELNGIHPKDAEPRAEQRLLSVGITPEQMKRFHSNLSGGEQQRVAIARSLASGAEILLADEPTGNLDVANTENIMAILSKLAHEDGYCVIIVTHDLDVAKAADVMYRMTDGALCFMT